MISNTPWPAHREHSIENVRGLILAAILKPASLIALGIAPADVEAFQTSAQNRFMALKAEIERAKSA